ncbi:hypothetical protein CRUP_031720 [Coryphaenoides rupestris]|nr:hypothetical protein CRUP_031720 [Coryphaenoides rupestris]
MWRKQPKCSDDVRLGPPRYALLREPPLAPQEQSKRKVASSASMSFFSSFWVRVALSPSPAA